MTFLLLGISNSGVDVVYRALRQTVGGRYADLSATLGMIGDFAARSSRGRTAEVGHGALTPQAATSYGVPALFEALCRAAAGEAAASYVVDATDVEPECPNLAAALVLMSAVPDVAAVVVWREAGPLVESRLQYLPHSDFASHCLAWAKAMQVALRLREVFPARTLLIRHQDLTVGRKAVAERLADFCSVSKGACEEVERLLSAALTDRTTAVSQSEAFDVARSAWSMPEIEIFHDVCGDMCAQLGCSIDLGLAERLRPLDLVSELLEGRWSLSGLSGSKPERTGTALLANALRAPAGPGSPLVVGGRTKLRLDIRPQQLEEDLGLRLEVTDCLSRRVILASSFTVRPGEDLHVGETIQPNGGMVEIGLAQVGGTPSTAFSLSLEQASLSHG